MQAIRVNVGDVTLQAQIYESAGDAVVFLHFSGANMLMWQRAVPQFQDRYRLLLVDLRGHGKSDRPESGYHMDDMARDVLGLMQQLGIERAHIVGSSMGAEVGLSLAAHHPESVRSLVCDGALSSEYGPYGLWTGSEAEFEAHVAGQLDKIRRAPETVYPSADALVAARRELFEGYGWWNHYFEAMERYGACAVGEGQYVRSFGKRALANYMQNYYHYRLEDYYKKVHCPLLMLAEAELDDARERAAMQGLSALAAQARIAEIGGWAHPYCWLLNPEAATPTVAEFLARGQ